LALKEAPIIPGCFLVLLVTIQNTANRHVSNAFCRQVRQSALCKQVVKAKPSPASTAAYPAVPCLHPLRAGRRSGVTPVPKKQRRKRKDERRRKHTHTLHYEILLGASVSDHLQNFATKEANL
jgi:hypothetical protein